MEEKSTNFLKYRMKDSPHGERYITFLTLKFNACLAENLFPLISNIAANDAELAGRLETLISQMLVHEKKLFSWLSTDASRMEFFLSDPSGTLRQALPELSEVFFNELNSLPKLFLQRK